LASTPPFDEELDVHAQANLQHGPAKSADTPRIGPYHWTGPACCTSSTFSAAIQMKEPLQTLQLHRTQI
jgi:hypothetical protein